MTCVMRRKLEKKDHYLPSAETYLRLRGQEKELKVEITPAGFTAVTWNISRASVSSICPNHSCIARDSNRWYFISKYTPEEAPVCHHTTRMDLFHTDNFSSLQIQSLPLERKEKAQKSTLAHLKREVWTSRRKIRSSIKEKS